MFEDGQRKDLKLGSKPKPIEVAATMLYFWHEGIKIPAESQLGETMYVLGLKPHALYDMEADDREVEEVKSDAGGILPIKLAPKSKYVIRLSPSPVVKPDR